MAKQGKPMITVSNVAGLVTGASLAAALCHAEFYLVIGRGRGNSGSRMYVFVPTAVTTSGSSISITYSLKDSSLASSLAAELADHTSAATAVSAGFLQPYFRSKLDRQDILLGASLLAGFSLALLGQAGHWSVALIAMLGFGVAWLTGASMLQAAAQLACPAWVRARAISERLKREAYKYAAGGEPYTDADPAKNTAALEKERIRIEDDGTDLLGKLIAATDLGSTLAQFKILTPYPGTPMFKQIEPLLVETDWEKFDGYTPTFKHPNLSAFELKYLLGTAYKRFYMRPSYLANFLKIQNASVREWVGRLDQRVKEHHCREEIADVARPVAC